MGCETIARPFGVLLMFLYDLVNNYGLALILIAVVIRVVLIPFQMKSKRGQLRQTRIQPKLAELQKKHGANKQKYQEEMAKLYKEEGVNPASGCLWNFIQMPVMILIFYAIRSPLTLMMGVDPQLLDETTGAIALKLQELDFSPTLTEFYVQVDQARFISQPENWAHFSQWANDGLQQISFALGPLDLSQTPNFRVWDFPWDSFGTVLPFLLLFLLPVLSGGAQFVSMAINRKMNPQGSPEAAAGTMGKVMKFMPLMSVWFGFILPAALSLYWTVGTVLQIGQDIWLTKKYTKILDAEDEERDKERKIKEAEIEAKRIETERKKAEGLAEQSLNTSKKKKKKGKKQDKQDKAAEWEKKTAPNKEDKEEKYEPSRVGNRKYARGRAYDPDRYAKGTDEETEESIDSEDSIEAVEGIDATQAISDSYESSEFGAGGADDVSDDGDDSEEHDAGDSSDEDGFDDDDGDDDSSAGDSDSDSDDDNDRADDFEIKEQAPPTERFDTKRFD